MMHYFQEKNTSWAYLDGYGLKDIFHLYAQKLTLSRSLFSFYDVLIGSRTTKNIEVSSAKSFTLDSRLSNKSFIYIYIYKNNGPRIEPWGTPVLIVSHSDSCPFRTTFYRLSNKKDSIKARRSPFFIWVFLQEHSWFTGRQRKEEVISLSPLYHFYPLHRHLDISRAITAESSPLHIANSQTRTGNLWFPSVSRQPLSYAALTPHSSPFTTIHFIL